MLFLSFMMLIFLAMAVGAMVVDAAGNAVFAIQLGDRHADEAALAHEGEACRAAFEVQSAASHQAFHGLFLLFVVVLFLFIVIVVFFFLRFFQRMQRGGFGEAGNFVVVRLAGEAVQMPGEAAGGAI